MVNRAVRIGDKPAVFERSLIANLLTLCSFNRNLPYQQHISLLHMAVLNSFYAVG